MLLRIVNDILSALDNDNISVLLLLDLSAAFDAIDHQILLSRLNSVLGIQSTAHQWFHSYLSDRCVEAGRNQKRVQPGNRLGGWVGCKPMEKKEFKRSAEALSRSIAERMTSSVG